MASDELRWPYIYLLKPYTKPFPILIRSLIRFYSMMLFSKEVFLYESSRH